MQIHYFIAKYLKFKHIIFGLLASSLFLGCEFKNEEDEFGTVCDTIDMRYADIELILSANCYRCHNDPPVAPFKLNTYIDVVNAVETRSLRLAVNHLPGVTPMPKFGNKLDSCSIAKINYWINHGTPK